MTFATSADLSSWATAFGVLIAALQLTLSRRQERVRFEDELSRQYRQLLRELPIDAVLRRPLTDLEIREALRVFVAYFDLCNEQVYLRSRGRIGRSTWREWSAGIRANFESEAFSVAWLRAEIPEGTFGELKQLRASETEHFDPIKLGPRLLSYLSVSW